MSTNIKAPVYATIALITGPWLFWHGFRTLRKRRLITNTPTARIRSMAMGLVEIKGAVEPRSTLTAPFSGKPCAYWQVDISSRHRRGWSVVHRNQSGNPFFLRDESGMALVYPRGAECKLQPDSEENYPGLGLPECYADYMNAHLTGYGRVHRLGHLRFRERILEEGERVYVLGTAVPRSPSHDVAEGELMLATGTDDAVATRLRTLDRDVAAVVRRGENETTFIIAQESEKSMVDGLGMRAFLEVVGGPALTLFGLAYWVMMISAGRWPW